MTSKYLKDIIKADFLLNGHLAVGAKLPTVRALAERYAVSTPTIGRTVEILAAEGWISKKSRSGLYVAKLPNDAEGASGKPQLKIGYITNQLGTISHLHPLGGVSQVVHNHNGILELAETKWKVDEERRQIDLMRRRGVQGVVLYPTAFRPQTDDYLGREFCDFPMVVVDLFVSAMQRSHVIFDNFSAGRDITRYLLSQGRTEIGFIKFEDTIAFRSVDDRVAGYRQALTDAGEAFIPDRVISFESANDFKHRKLLAAVDFLLAHHPRLQALVAPYDGAVPAIIRHLRKKGIAVPQDIKVAGFDNDQTQQVEYWPTTNPNFLRMGERAAEMLIKQIETGDLSVSESMMSCPVMIPEQEGEPGGEFSEKDVSKSRPFGISKERLLASVAV